MTKTTCTIGANQLIQFLDIDECIYDLDNYLFDYIDEIEDSPTAIDNFYNDVVDSIRLDRSNCSYSNLVQENVVKMTGFKDENLAPTIYYTIKLVEVKIS